MTDQTIQATIPLHPDLLELGHRVAQGDVIGEVIGVRAGDKRVPIEGISAHD